MFVRRGIPDALCGFFGCLVVLCEAFRWRKLIYVRPSERSSRYEYMCVSTLMKAFSVTVPWHIEGRLRVTCANRTSRLRGDLPSHFIKPRLECRCCVRVS